MSADELKKQVRQVFLKHLAALNEDLAHFEQTTHAHMLASPILENLFYDIGRMLQNPTSYTISNASQSIKDFLHIQSHSA